MAEYLTLSSPLTLPRFAWKKELNCSRHRMKSRILCFCNFYISCRSSGCECWLLMPKYHWDEPLRFFIPHALLNVFYFFETFRCFSSYLIFHKHKTEECCFCITGILSIDAFVSFFYLLPYQTLITNHYEYALLIFLMFYQNIINLIFY